MTSMSLTVTASNPRSENSFERSFDEFALSDLSSFLRSTLPCPLFNFCHTSILITSLDCTSSPLSLTDHTTEALLVFIDELVLERPDNMRADHEFAVS